MLAAGLLPCAWIACNVFGWLGYEPAVDPVKFLQLEFGQTALNLIMLTLMITPVRLLTGYTHLLRLRRLLGLLAFSYASLHLTVYVVLDLDLGSLKKERIKKRIYKTRALATAEVSDYIECFYN